MAHHPSSLKSNLVRAHEEFGFAIELRNVCKENEEKLIGNEIDRTESQLVLSGLVFHVGQRNNSRFNGKEGSIIIIQHKTRNLIQLYNVIPVVKVSKQRIW